MDPFGQEQAFLTEAAATKRSTARARHEAPPFQPLACFTAGHNDNPDHSRRLSALFHASAPPKSVTASPPLQIQPRPQQADWAVAHDTERPLQRSRMPGRTTAAAILSLAVCPTTAAGLQPETPPHRPASATFHRKQRRLDHVTRSSGRTPPSTRPLESTAANGTIRVAKSKRHAFNTGRKRSRQKNRRTPPGGARPIDGPPEMP